MVRQLMVSIAFVKIGISVDHVQLLTLRMVYAIQMIFPMRLALTHSLAELIASSTVTIALQILVNVTRNWPLS